MNPGHKMILFLLFSREVLRLFRHAASSVASAANAAIDSVRSLINPTEAGNWNSVCVASDGSYGTKEGLITSFPIRSDGENWEIVQDLPINDFARQKIDVSVNELAEERELVSDLLPG